MMNLDSKYPNKLGLFIECPTTKALSLLKTEPIKVGTSPASLESWAKAVKTLERQQRDWSRSGLLRYALATYKILPFSRQDTA